MDQSYSDSDITMSPSAILERLEMLRQLQVLQRSKLQKHMNFQDSSEITRSITEIVSHFSDSTSYNTFRSLLESAQENEINQSSEPRGISQRGSLQNVVEGVTLLNLSQESEFLNNTASSTKSSNKPTNYEICNINKVIIPTKQISLDEMPILSPRKDFETLLLDKLKKEENQQQIPQISKNISTVVPKVSKRPFLKRGEGMARFGLNKKDLIIQNTKALPWKKNSKKNQSKKIILNNSENNNKKKSKCDNNHDQKQNVEISEQSLSSLALQQLKSKQSEQNEVSTEKSIKTMQVEPEQNVSCNNKDSILNCNGKTWASVLSKEQNDLLMKLKQSEYYKNFLSPSKSVISDISCDDNVSKVTQEKEIAEQNLFELLENKVNHDSFSIENSFFHKFLGRTAFESSGESTPFILNKCISDNPKLMNIAPSSSSEHSQLNCNSETCNCEECSDTCSSVSCCCSCKTVTENVSLVGGLEAKRKKENVKKKYDTIKPEEKTSHETDCQHESVVNNEVKISMAEMNAKLQATSELLKERLKELEDEIETFRKENLNLTKMREEIDLERQKFYDEKQQYEKKFNEDKILSEYYLAEEKEKLQKQKQLYERYLRDIRGRINKKDKDEVVNLKKEIQDLKEEIRIKDAKSTTAIARLRNQIKIMDKEKKSHIDEIEKLKKENHRIQHSNDITRRLTNIKYLEQINKKLKNRSSRDDRSDVDLDPDIKYKAHIIERQSRSRTIQQVTKPTSMRPRAKSVPNLNVTSRYAKYFSQKDSSSDLEKYKVIHDNDFASNNEDSDNDIAEDLDDKDISRNSYLYDDDNNLEKIYNDRFKSDLPSKQTHHVKHTDYYNNEHISDFFLSKDNEDHHEKSKRHSKSSCAEPIHTDHSPTMSNTPKSPIYLPNYSTSSGISTNNSVNVSINENNRTSTQKQKFSNSGQQLQASKINSSSMTPSPEPNTIFKPSLTKTNLNPTEIVKPDGSKELRFPNGNIKFISGDGKYSKFIYYNGDIKENFYNEGRIKYFYAENKTVHTTHADGLEVLEFPDGQIEKRYKDGSSEIRLPNGSVRYFDPKNEHVREEWRFPDGATMTVSANGDQRIMFPNGQIEVHTTEHKRREFPDGTVKLIYNDGTSETRYSSGRVRIKDKHGNLIMDSAPG